MAKNDELIKLVESHKDLSSQLKQYRKKKDILSRMIRIQSTRKKLLFPFPLKKLRVSLNVIQLQDDEMIVDKAIRNIDFNLSAKEHFLDQFASEIRSKIIDKMPIIYGLCDVDLFRDRDHTDQELAIRQIWLRYEAEEKQMTTYEPLLMFQTILNYFAANEPKQPYDTLESRTK